jgi:hypothetical protein
MDDLAPHKKKKFGGIRKLGKFFGLGGRSSRSETKSQIDDCEEFDSVSVSPNNGIESIMALTEEQKAQPIISFLLSSEEDDVVDNRPGQLHHHHQQQSLKLNLASGGGFKPKSLPSSLSRAPGRETSSPKSASTISQAVDTEQQSTVQSPRPSAPPPPKEFDQQQQRVEDLIRSKIVLKKKKSKLLDPGPDSAMTSPDPKATPQQLSSPVSNASVNGFSPLASSPAAASTSFLEEQSFVLPPHTEVVGSDNSSSKNQEAKVSPTHELRLAATPSPAQQFPRSPTPSSSSPSPTSASNGAALKNRTPSLVVVNISLTLSESSDPTDTSPVVDPAMALINKSYRSLSDDDALRCTSFDLTDPSNRSSDHRKGSVASCDSDDSLPSPAILSIPIITKSKEDLRAEFASFRQNSKLLKSSLSGSSESGTSPLLLSSTSPMAMSLSRSTEHEVVTLLTCADEDGVVREGGEEGGEEQEQEEEESVSSYASDEIQSLVSTDDEGEDETSTGHQHHHPIFHTESIPEGVEEEDSDDAAEETADVNFKVTATRAKKQHLHKSSSSSSANSFDSFKPSSSSSTAVSLPSSKHPHKRMSLSSSSSSTSPSTTPRSGTVTSSTSKQRSKSIFPNSSTPLPNQAASSSSASSGWNGSTKQGSTSSKLSNPFPGSGTTGKPSSSSHKPSSKRQSLSVNSSVSSTALQTPHSSPRVSTDPDSPEIKITRVSAPPPAEKRRSTLGGSNTEKRMR